MPILINICISTGVLEAFAFGRESEIGTILKMLQTIAAVVSRGIQILADWCVEVDEEPKVLVGYDWGNQEF